MKSPARILILAGIFYYAVMILVYLGREVEGSGPGRFARMSAVAYFFSMIALYLDREVLSTVQVLADAPEDPQSDEHKHESPRTSR